jgi:predicted DNA binding CopG/RHH family protein
MKQPNLRHLKIDRTGTATMRKALRKSQVTITINLHSADLQALNTRSKKSGVPYQRLLNTLITTTVSQQESIQSRMDRLEQELRKVKRHVAA